VSDLTLESSKFLHGAIVRFLAASRTDKFPSIVKYRCHATAEKLEFVRINRFSWLLLAACKPADFAG